MQNKSVGLDMLNMSFVHYKKLAKIQFLKFGKHKNVYLVVSEYHDELTAAIGYESMSY